MVKKLLLSIIIGGLFFMAYGCSSTGPQVDGPEALPNGLLFEVGEPGFTQFYNYAPTIFEENGVRHLYYCSNQIEGNVTDYVAYRTATQASNGVWVYGEISFVLGPTENTWDSRHTCDPSVIKGEFQYKNETYHYLMAYLGCVTSDNQSNEVGIAVAKDPAGPWIKYDKNPIVPYNYNPDVKGFQWGTGQPSLVSADKAGEVLLFYTEGNGMATFTGVKRYDFSNLDNPVLLEENVFTTRGFKDLNNNQGFFYDADFAYDAINNRIYAITSDAPHPTTEPTNIPYSNSLVYIYDNNAKVGDVLFNSEGKGWNFVDRVDESKTGFARNHNMGVLTDPYGWLLQSNSIDIVTAVSIETGSFWGNLSNYRLYQVTIPILE